MRRAMTILAMLAGLSSPFVQAAGAADKIEALGTPDHIKVEALRMVTRNGFLNVQAEIVNTSTANRTLYYRFKWLDSAGFAVGDEEPWKAVTLVGLQKKALQTMAMQPTATDFRLELQAPENSAW